MFAQHAIACVLCELLLELFLVFFQTLKRFLTSFSILFNFQGPVAPQPCGWRPVYFTTEVVFCQALFFRSFWTFWTWTLKKLLRTNWNFSASIGSFQGLPAEASEVILLPQRLALKYNTTPPPPCQHFLTDFFQFLCRIKDFPVFHPLQGVPFSWQGCRQNVLWSHPRILYDIAILIL